MYAAINAGSSAADLCKSFSIAAVVFPNESSASVLSLTIGSNPAISAFPPALSAIGPNASVANVIPNVESIPIAANAIP